MTARTDIGGKQTTAMAEADSSAALRNDKPKEQTTARAKSNTEILAAPE
jgi:hypothetical protein